MRFDDMLATLLAQPLGDQTARAAAWRQIVDVLAQGHGYRPEDRLVDAPRKIDAYNLLRTLRPEIPIADRIDVARSLSGRRLPPDLVALFAEEPASVAGPVLGEARLIGDEWIALLPMLSPMARGLLRHRRDLPREVGQALDAFGTSDFVISASPGLVVEQEVPPLVMAPAPDPEPAPAQPQPIDGERQIKDLLRRIESFRARVAERRAETRATGEAEDIAPVEEFRFETAVDGVIIWVDGAPRGALVGETIATAGNADHGVDGHAAGAYRRRAPFRDARLSISAEGPVHGEWRISAVPFFEPSDGRFTGYRGTARRPRPDETAKPAGEGGLFGTGVEADSLRQLVHELRTPLNAIVGFSEMIENQYMGPAASGYRTKAADIVAQGKRMLAAVDDLDMAAKVESRRLAADRGSIDASAMLQRLHGDYLPVANDRGVDLAFRIAAKLPPIAGDPVAVERMFTRLIAATISLAQSGEQVMVELVHDRDRGSALALSVARPRVLAGREERLLLDPGYNPEEDWPEAPVLGLGFALRLVRNLAAAAGGRLDIEEEHFVLRLPARHDAAQTGESGA